MSWAKLYSHTSIGWDIDDTLLNTSHASVLFNFIESTPDRNHNLITFRNGNLLDGLRDELENARPGIFEKFTELYTLPEGIEWDKSSCFIRAFKPLTCVQNYITVLVDDLTWLDKECRSYGVDYIVPKSLFHADYKTDILDIKIITKKTTFIHNISCYDADVEWNNIMEQFESGKIIQRDNWAYSVNKIYLIKRI